MQFTRRQALVALTQAAAFPAFAQAWPERAVKWIVPYAPGGASDVITRVVGQKVAEITGQPVVIENRPGAASLLATEEFSRARPDGHSILTASGSALSIHPELNRKLRFDPDKDFEPICGLMKLSQVMVVRNDLGVKSLADLTAYIRRQNSKASFSSVGVGSPNHLSGELYLRLIGGSAVHIPFNGTGASLNELVAGRVDFSVTDLVSSGELVKKGLITALAVPDETRHRLYPQLPTFKEAGLPLTAFSWFGVMLPKGSSPDLIRSVHKAVSTALAHPAIVERYHSLGAEVLDVPTPERFREFIKSERTRWSAIIRERGITAE
jgi:tripartite-type tricarboxylate transporter receptor subunit TctC